MAEPIQIHQVMIHSKTLLESQLPNYPCPTMRIPKPPEADNLIHVFKKWNYYNQAL